MNEATPLRKLDGNPNDEHHYQKNYQNSSAGIELRPYNALPMDPNKYHETLNVNAATPASTISEEFESQSILFGKNNTTVKRIAGSLLALVTVLISLSLLSRQNNDPILDAAWSSKALPFSTVDPASLNVIVVDRPFSSKPGPVFGELLERGPDDELLIPLPTNNWYENLLLGSSTVDAENKVFAVPYILDTSGYIQGIRSHPAHVQANDRTVMMTYEEKNGMSLGAVEPFHHQHHVHTSKTVPRPSKLAIELEWTSAEDSSVKMRCPIVRGAPYASMEYVYSTPRIFVERAMSGKMILDNDPFSSNVLCGSKFNEFSQTPFLVEKEIKIHFDTSDMTWLIFVSEPTSFICTNSILDSTKANNLPPGVVPPATDPNESPLFELRATKPMRRGMVRIAMSNNCTTGQNPQYCVRGQPKDETAFEQLLRDHSNVYPTAEADIQFTFPVQSSEEEELRLIFNWKSALMSDMASFDNDDSLYPSVDVANNKDYYHGGSVRSGYKLPSEELLMFALPHHQERMRQTVLSSNAVQTVGCSPTIHGMACPAVGGVWSMVEHLHRASFSAPRVPREEMIGSLQDALRKDILYEIPANYMAGAGDTYFSGKMLGKLARILLVADEVGGVSKQEFDSALGRLRAGVEIWINGSAESPLLYDNHWGGIVSCGCDYFYEDGVGGCRNAYPNCPALTDAGQNFGAGFYNDHHYHYGYHIYAAAVLSKFDHVWGRKFHEHVLLLVRDIANPSDDDVFFPKWRHKDWFVGFSWASGIVTINGKPYPNGRNQESSSEAISAYEAVALYGDVLSTLYTSESSNPHEKALYDAALRIRDMGRLLMATEIRSAKTYWHVQSKEAVGVSRIYPEIYEPKVIGMMWSMLAQEQTWFGSEPWKSYGIQLMPITPASEQRDSGSWLNEMLPVFAASCLGDKNCVAQGWSVLVYACMASVGDWQGAWKGMAALNDSVFLEAGGDGHSLSNSLWYVATRPDPEDLLE